MEKTELKIKIRRPQIIKSDDRGDFIQVAQGQFGQLSIINLKALSFRGRHYHKKTTETFYIYSGKVKLIGFQVETHEKESVIVEAQHVFAIEPNWYHTVIGLTDTVLIVLPDKPSDSGSTDIYQLEPEIIKQYNLE